MLLVGVPTEFEGLAAWVVGPLDHEAAVGEYRAVLLEAPIAKSCPFSKMTAGPISEAHAIVEGEGSGAPALTHWSVARIYLSEVVPLILTVRTLPSCKSVQVSSSVFPVL
jgi:hypothetical protein